MTMLLVPFPTSGFTRQFYSCFPFHWSESSNRISPGEKKKESWIRSYRLIEPHPVALQIRKKRGNCQAIIRYIPIYRRQIHIEKDGPYTRLEFYTINTCRSYRLVRYFPFSMFYADPRDLNCYLWPICPELRTTHHLLHYGVVNVFPYR